MNRRQYDLVKSFLQINIPAQRISKEFKADLSDVKLVAGTNNFDQYEAKKKEGTKNFFEDLMKGWETI